MHSTPVTGNRQHLAESKRRSAGGTIEIDCPVPREKARTQYKSHCDDAALEPNFCRDLGRNHSWSIKAGALSYGSSAFIGCKQKSRMLWITRLLNRAGCGRRRS